MTFVFKHPKYYKELRSRNKTGQAISEPKTVDIGDSVRPGQGLKQQAASDKLQAPSESNNKPQASSDKQIESLYLNPSFSSAKILVPENNLQEP